MTTKTLGPSLQHLHIHQDEKKKEQRKYGEKKERKQKSRKDERGNDENNLHVVTTLNTHNKRKQISLTIKIKKHKITNK
jgi:hypothetical protein